MLFNLLSRAGVIKTFPILSIAEYQRFAFFLLMLRWFWIHDDWSFTYMMDEAVDAFIIVFQQERLHFSLIPPAPFDLSGT
jgi:hypothetical protein